MPVTSVLISSAIKAFMVKSIKGRDAGTLADAVGRAVAQHITTPNMVSCTLNGTAGPFGNLTSLPLVGVVGKAMAGIMTLKAQGRLTGRDSINLFDAISSGVAQVLLTATLTGTCAGCAVGAGTGKFTALSASVLSGLILLSCSFRGRNMVDLADCISFGIVNQLKAGATFTVTVTGAVAPTPPTGPVAVVGIPSLTTKVN